MRGVQKSRLHVYDYPLRRAFDQVSGHSDGKSGFVDLDRDRRTLLISLGGQGHGNVDKLLDALVARRIPINVIYIAGRNESIQERLRNRFAGKSGPVRVIVLGYVDNMAEVMNQADICFIKPGPSTTMEAVYLRKPIIFFKSAQLSENGNIDFALRRGIGYYVGENQKRFLEVVESLVKGDLLEKTARNYEKIRIRNGASDIARFIIDILDRTDTGHDR
jgi:UDP-N-acetylglucosamine:LPS N-acetylglucosamine transferase